MRYALTKTEKDLPASHLILFTYELHYKTVTKGVSIQKTKITSNFAYEITLYDFSYIKYKNKIFWINFSIVFVTLIIESSIVLQRTLMTRRKRSF